MWYENTCDLTQGLKESCHPCIGLIVHFGQGIWDCKDQVLVSETVEFKFCLSDIFDLRSIP